MRFILRLLCIIAVVAGVGFLYQTISSYIDHSRYSPPGILVDIGGYKLHLIGAGNSGPIVILDAGLGCNSLDWSLVQPEIAKFARAYSYDRAGYGWSEESHKKRTSSNIVDELHALLTNAKIPAPYIFVGHSFGGINAQLYASKYPDEVAGLVLVDSCHEAQLELLPDDESASTFFAYFTSWANPSLGRYTGPLGISRLFLNFIDIESDLKSFSKPIKEQYLAAISTSKFSRTIFNEDSHFAESLKQLKDTKRSLKSFLKNKPIIVITAGWQPENQDESMDKVNIIWTMLQEDLANQSDTGKHWIAEESDHMIPWNQPSIIVEAVYNLCNQKDEFICR